MRVAKALGGLHQCLGLHEPSLLANAISTRISCAGLLAFVARIQYIVYAESEGAGGTARMLRLV